MGLAGAVIGGAALSTVGGIVSGGMAADASKSAANTQAQASQAATAQTLQAAQRAITTMEGYGGQALGVLSPFFSGMAGPGPAANGNVPLSSVAPGASGAPGAAAGGSATGSPTAAQLQAVAKARPDLYSAFQKDGSTNGFGSWLQTWYSGESPGGAQYNKDHDSSIVGYNNSTNSPSFGGFVNSIAGTGNGGAYTVPTAPSDVASYYQSHLGRAPTAAEMNSWNADAELGTSPAKIMSDVQASVTSSPEYQADQQAGKVGSDGTFYQAPGMADLSALAKGSSSSPVISNLQSLANLSAPAYAPLAGYANGTAPALSPLSSIASGANPSMQNLASWAGGTAPGQATSNSIVQGNSPALAAEQAVVSGNAPTLQPLSALANGTSGLTAGLLPAQIAGSAASGELMKYLTNPGSYQTSPAYQFERDQGLNAITNAASATGAGGNTQQAAAKYAEGLAGQDYFNTLTSLQSLAGLGVNAAGTAAGIGSGAATSLGGIGQSAAANLTGAQTGAAADLLSGQTAAATALPSIQSTASNNLASIGASTAGQLTSTAAGAQTDMASIIANALSQLYGGSLSSSQSAAALLGNLGSSIGSTTVGAGNSVSNNIIGAANANAAGQIGSANAISGGINSATSGVGNNLLLYSLLNKAA